MGAGAASLFVGRSTTIPNGLSCLTKTWEGSRSKRMWRRCLGVTLDELSRISNKGGGWVGVAAVSSCFLSTGLVSGCFSFSEDFFCSSCVHKNKLRLVTYNFHGSRTSRGCLFFFFICLLGRWLIPGIR